MRILKDVKLPKFRFPRFKMNEIPPRKGDTSYAEESNERVTEIKDFKPYEATEYKTIKEVFLRSTDVYADNTCILEKRNPKEAFKEYTYKEFGSDVIGFGTGLEKYLNLHGKPIIIIGENCYQWYISYMSMLCGSTIAVPVDKELPAHEFVLLAKRARAAAVIFTPKKRELIDKIADELPETEYFIEMYSESPLDGKKVGFDSVMNIGKKLVEGGEDCYTSIEIDPEEFKVLIFTSGTTAASKGVMICNRNLAENINAVSAYVKLYEEDRLLSVLPLHHTYESTIGFLVPFAWGTSVAVCQGLKYIVKNMNEVSPSIILTVPILVENIYKKIRESLKKAKKNTIVSSLIHITNGLKTVNVDIKRRVFAEIINSLGGKMRLIISAAAPIDGKIGKWIDNIGITFLQGYGLTETAPIAALTPEKKPKIGTVGIPVICAKIKINNPNENGEGEIMIKSKTLMLGYYEDEEATREAVTEDGWFHSGDMGKLDNEGFIRITGRLKNVIITSNGKNVYPEEIEELVMREIPEIKECMVYGKRDDSDAGKDLESVIAIKVIPDYDALAEKLNKKRVTPEEAYEDIWKSVKEVNKKLVSYKGIKELEIKEDEFEKTSTMKIKRYAEISKDKDKSKDKKKDKK